MWKGFVLWFLFIRTILPQPVLTENIREARQVDFVRCCPCPDSDGNDQNILPSMIEARAVDDCPCRSTPDSESASSILRPALRVVEPFVRPSPTKGEPKTLLKPEVGLTNSVLETLREATDQEYQEAVERDAARSAMSDNEQNSFHDEMPKHIVNIVFKPKENSDDALSAASHVQETRCIHPSPLGVKRLGQRPQNRMFGELLTLPKLPSKGLLHKKMFDDMENSPSNLQEQVLPPFRSTILDDLKHKSDLLKMKLFPNLRNGLKTLQPEIDIANSRENNVCDNSDNLVLDHVKVPKTNHLMSTLQSNRKDTQRNDIRHDHMKNNKKGEFFGSSKTNINTMESEILPDARNFYNTNVDTLNKISKVNKKTAIINDNELDFVPFKDTNLEENFVAVQDLSEDDCNANYDKQQLTGELSKNPIETKILDAAPSPSEINEVKNTIDDTVNNISKEFDNNFNRNKANNIQEIDGNQERTIEETTLGNDILSGKMDHDNNNANNRLFNDNKNGNDEKSACLVKDSETDASDNNIQLTNDPPNENNLIFSIDKSNNPETLDTENRENQLITGERSTPDVINKISVLPNIKSDILKTLENFKVANEKIQDKLRLNVQKALQLASPKNDPREDNESFTLSTSTKESSNDDSNMSMQDLQNMSNRILNLSESLSRDSQNIEENADCDGDTIRKNDDNVKAGIEKNALPGSLSDKSEPVIDLLKPLFKNSEEILDEENLNDKNADEDSVNHNKPISVNNCDDSVPKHAVEYENEMMPQASSPYINSVAPVKMSQNLVPDQKFMTNVNVKEFLENLKSSVSDILNTDKSDLNSNIYNDNENDNSNTNSIFLRQDQQTYFKEPTIRLSEPKKMDMSRNYYKAPIRGAPSPRKNNLSLNSYKAKVASPDTLSLNTLPTVRNTKQSYSQRLFNDNSKLGPTSGILGNPLNVPNIKSLSDFNPLINLKNTNPHQDILQSIGPLKSISENFKSHTEEAFRNIQDTFDATFKKPQLKSDNIIFAETLTKPILFGTISNKNDDLGQKLHAFHTDLMDRLSLISPRIPSQDSLSWKTKSKMNDLDSRIKSKPKLNLARNHDTLKSKQNLPLPNTLRPSSIRREGIPKSHLLQKSVPTSRRIGSDLIENLPKLQLPAPKTPLRKEIKRKPLTESKITFSFTTTTTVRPERTKPNSATLRSSINLPKSSLNLKTPAQRRLELKSKLKSDDPKILASERIVTHALPDKIPVVSLSEEELEQVKDLSEEADVTKTGDRFSDNLDKLKEHKLGLSKLKNSINSRTANNNYNTNNIIESASNNNINIAAATSIEKPLKENVSYKCKMVCFEDKMDS